MSVALSYAPTVRNAATAVFLLLVCELRGAEPVPPGSPVPSDPIFTAYLLDGTTRSGRIHQIGPQAQIALVPERGPEVLLPLAQLLKLTRDRSTLRLTPSEGSVVLFPDGDRLCKAVIGPASETTLDVSSYALGNLAIPLESLLGLILTLPRESAAVDALCTRVRSEERTTEVLWLANGDRLGGGFLGLDEKRVKFQAATGPAAIERAGVDALGFDPAVVAYPRPEGDFLELTMADGSRLGVTGARIEQGHVVASTRFKTSIRLALSELIQIHARTSTIAYLSERPAAAEQYVPFLGPARPYRRDQNVDGHPLVLAGQGYDRGLGTQSRTLLAYRLAAGDRRFQATVGIDDAAGPLGSVVFRVLVDGKERYVSPALSVRDTPKPIDVDLTGAKVLVLVTEFGERGDVRDFADWVEARIIR
jgi:hypothetical protein